MMASPLGEYSLRVIHARFMPSQLNYRDRYKAAGVQFIDERGSRDVTEFLNIARDDALAWPTPVHRTYPTTVNARMDSTIKPFVQKSLAINNLLIGVLNDKLGLPQDTLAACHKVGEHSGCTARVIRAAPQQNFDDKVFLTAHTDFGSLVSQQMDILAALLSCSRALVVPA